MQRALSLLLLAPLPLTACRERPASQALVLAHATAVDVRDGTLLPDRTVLVVGDRIRLIAPSAAIEPPRGARVQAAPGEIVGPRFIANGPILDGAWSPWPGSVLAATPETARAAVDSLARGGADFIKVYSARPPQVYFAVTEEAQRIGIPVAGRLMDPAERARTLAAAREATH